MLCYTGLFSGVLPFICLGALGEPGHPHPFPHFVFAIPHGVTEPLTTVDPLSLAGTEQSYHHGGHRGQTTDMPSPTNPTIPPKPTHCPLVKGTVPGRATASIIIFAILQLVILGYTLRAPWATPHFALYHRFAWLQSLTLTVPIPPPRLATAL